MIYKLRKWQETDVYQAAELATESVSSFMSDEFPGHDVEKWKKVFTLANDETRTLYRVIEVDGNFAGSIGVHVCDDIMRMNAELGYWIAEEYRGRGIATKAVNEIVEMAFSNYQINRIFATPFGNNYASQRVLEKTGFKPEAVLEKVYIKNGVLQDELVYAIRK